MANNEILPVFGRGDIVIDFIPSDDSAIQHPQIILGVMESDAYKGMSHEYIVLDTETIIGTSKWPANIEGSPYFLVYPDKSVNGLDSITGFNMAAIEIHNEHNMKDTHKIGALSTRDLKRLTLAEEKWNKLSLLIKSKNYDIKITKDAFIGFNTSQEAELKVVYEIDDVQFEKKKSEALYRKSKI